MSILRASEPFKGWVQIVRTFSIPTERSPQKRNCANIGQLNRELSDNYGRLKTNRTDDRQYCANSGIVLKEEGLFVSPLAVKLATEGGG